MNDLGEQIQKGLQRGLSRPQPPPSPTPYTIVVVGLICLLLMGTSIYYAHVDAVIALVYAILSVAVTTVWCCLYMDRR